MQTFNLSRMSPASGGEKPQQVFYEGDNFTTRVIQLEAGGGIPECEMTAAVIFNVISGQVEITVNGETRQLNSDECLITEPATVSMQTDTGAKLMGTQIEQ